MRREAAVEWVEPLGGVVCFPRIRQDLPVDVAEFHRLLNDEHGTYLGPGRWFGFDDRYFRIGYAWPTEDELRAGLDSISASIQAATR
jgi:aspartate/methionine/tyrosine aminotransferase